MNEEDEEWWRAKKAGEDGTREVTPLDLNMDLGFTQVIHAITNSVGPATWYGLSANIASLAVMPQILFY